MGMCISEKIIANKLGREKVNPNEIVSVSPEFVMSNDATTHIAIDIFKKKIGATKVKHSSKIIFVMDHNVPSDSVDTAMVHKKMTNFANEQKIDYLYVGEGVCHQLLVENHVLPNQIIVGADSHTCTCGALGCIGIGIGSTDNAVLWKTGEIWLRVPPTIKFEIEGDFPEGVYAKDLILKIIGDIGADGATYKAMEFSGPAITKMSIDSRLTICNMAVEAGAKNGIIAADKKALDYLSNRIPGGLEPIKSDPDAEYDKIYEYDVSKLEPMVACPHTVDNVKPVREVEGLRIDEAFIGSCTNGRLEDLRIAAKILDGNNISHGMKLIVSPVSRKIFKQALKEGLIETFLESGAIVMNPNCSTCWGACQGVLSHGERLITTGNRNFKGRVGSPDSEIYLASPATVAASAVNGKITEYTKEV